MGAQNPDGILSSGGRTVGVLTPWGSGPSSPTDSGGNSCNTNHRRLWSSATLWSPMGRGSPWPGSWPATGCDPRRLRLGPAPVRGLVRPSVTWPVLGPQSDIETYGRGPRGAGSGPGHRRPTAVHRGRLLPLRRRGRPARPLAGGARAPTPDRLRVPRHRPGPQRGRALCSSPPGSGRPSSTP